MTESTAEFPFAYAARTADGQPITGTVDAHNPDDARRKLQSLQLDVSEISRAAPKPRAGRLSGDDFLAFNQQLAQLAVSGLPVEQGLELIAQEMRRGALRNTIELITSDLQRGLSLAQAVDKYRACFPPLYGRLVEAGVRSGNLSEVLLGLGEHMALFRRLQSTIIRTLTYPLIVALLFLGVLAFVLMRVTPEFSKFYYESHVQLPAITQVMIELSVWANSFGFLIAAIILAFILLLAIALLRSSRKGERVVQTILLPMPLFGPVIQRSLIARWCDAVGLGVEAGLDLPESIRLADDAIDSPPLRLDGMTMIDALSAGQALESVGPGRVLPPMVPVTMALASLRGDLAHTLRTLAQMYRLRSEQRLAAIPGIVTPFMLVVIAALVVILAIALLAPIVEMMNFLK